MSAVFSMSVRSTLWFESAQLYKLKIKTLFLDNFNLKKSWISPFHAISTIQEDQEAVLSRPQPLTDTLFRI